MRLYIARHGQTDWNKEGKAQGCRNDIPLNETGRRQARELAEKLPDTPINLILSSPLKRAYETAQIIADRCHFPIQVDEGVREMDLGEWGGCSWHESGADQVRFYNKNVCPPGGESSQEFAARVKKYLNQLYETYKDSNQNTLIVAHGMFAQAVEWAINGVKVDKDGNEISSIPHNGEVREYQIVGTLN
jgi:probable phosphoglycerate mutase